MTIDYERNCREAASRQGLDPLSELETLGYDYGVDQTGGYCMCGRVDRTDDKPGWVWITFESDGFLVIAYRDEDEAFDAGGTILAEAATFEQIPALLDEWLR